MQYGDPPGFSLHCSWSEVQGVDPLDRYQDSIFFRTVEKAFNEGNTTFYMFELI